MQDLYWNLYIRLSRLRGLVLALVLKLFSHDCWSGLHKAGANDVIPVSITFSQTHEHPGETRAVLHTKTGKEH